MDFFRNIFGSNRSENFGDFSPPEGSPRFDVFSDPMQMQQFFEEEIDKLLKSFGFGSFNQFHSQDNFIPSLEEGSSQNENPQSLREQFLKKGFEKEHTPKVDRDLDDRVISGRLDALLDEDDHHKPHQQMIPKSFNIITGASKTMKTITKPDGSIETESTTRDSRGNEETTTCRIFGDKEYCIIRKRTKGGKEEVTEHFVNMDESEKDKFFPKR